MPVVDRDPLAPIEDDGVDDGGEETVDGVLLTVDYEGPFTLDEIDYVETVSGVPLPKWFNGETNEGALMRAIACVKVRRHDPEYLLFDAGAQVHLPAGLT